MKKLIFIATLLVVLSLAFYAEAADSARSVDRGESGIEQTVALADMSSGAGVEIDSDGNIKNKPWAATYIGALDGTVTITGACTVYGIYLYGDASSTAGDYALVYDALTVTGTPKFDISIDVAKGSASYTFPVGVKFTTGVTVDVIDGNAFCSVVYDQ